MDEFGVLTERYGLKPQGKSAPMASSKRPTNANARDSQTLKSGTNSGLNHKTSQFGSRSHQNPTFDYAPFFDDIKKTQHFGGLDDGIDGIFGGHNKSNVDNGGSFDYDSIFAGSNKSVSTTVDNGFVDDIFDGFASPPGKQGVAVDDLLDEIGGVQAKPTSLNGNGTDGVAKKAPEFDDLIPGFGASSVTNNGSSTKMNKPRKPTVSSNKPAVTSHDDPFLVFETASSTASSESFLDSLEQIRKLNNSKVNNSSVSSIDELEEFAMGRVQNNPSRMANIHTGEIKQNSAANTNKSKGAPNASANQFNGMDDDLESFFSTSSRSTSVPKSRSTAMDDIFDHQMQNKGRPEVSQIVPSGSSVSIKKSSVVTSLDDLSLIFGGSPSSEFNEIEGETEERRKARLGRHQRTQERAAKALADMNQRDLQIKMEQEERRRIADAADVQIKLWATGKEGNMRALLSTLQHVLWPECGWQPVSLTDMITSASVKKVYRKATLCIHPDKVQQKGANLEQKYAAEKIFDILKEACSKFNAEELS